MLKKTCKILAFFHVVIVVECRILYIVVEADRDNECDCLCLARLFLGPNGVKRGTGIRMRKLKADGENYLEGKKGEEKKKEEKQKDKAPWYDI